jgi:hypothetical protein
MQYLPPPDPPNPDEASGGAPQDESQNPQTHYQRRARKRPAIPSVEEIMATLVELNGLVLTGLVSTDKAIVINRNLRTVLDAQLKKRHGEPTREVGAGLVDLCRANPSVLNLLEPFLTEDQLKCLLDQIREDENGQT